MISHSVNDSPVYIGTEIVNGLLCHRWLDGTALPVLQGAADDDGGGDDDSGSDDDKDDDDSGDDDQDDKDKDDDDDDERKPSEKSTNRAHRDAARYRTQRNKARADLTAEAEAHTATKSELEKVKKDGVTDETMKAEMVALKEENATLKGTLVELQGHETERKLERQISDEIEELDIDGDADYVLIKLRKNDMLTVDSEDGEIEDLTANLKKLLKKGVLKKNDASGDDDGDKKESSSGSSGASRSGRSGKSPRGDKTNGLDLARLAKKYPALRR